MQQNWTTISKFCYSAAKKDIISSQNSLLNFAETTIFYRVLPNHYKFIPNSIFYGSPFLRVKYKHSPGICKKTQKLFLVPIYAARAPRRIWARQGPIFYPKFFDWLLLERIETQNLGKAQAWRALVGVAALAYTGWCTSAWRNFFYVLPPTV